MADSTDPTSPPGPNRPKFMRQPKPPPETEQRNKSWPYPKELYHPSGSYRVVHSPEEHKKSTSEGWADDRTADMTYVPWTAEEQPKPQLREPTPAVAEPRPEQPVERSQVQAPEPESAESPTHLELVVSDDGSEKKKSVGSGKTPPRRTPDIETSRERITLRNKLATELATIKPDLGRYCTPDHLKKKYPKFELWDILQPSEIQELIDGDQVKPTAYAGNLALRKYGLTSLHTIKKDQQKLRKAKTK